MELGLRVSDCEGGFRAYRLDLTPLRLENRIEGQGHRHTRISFRRKHELMRSSGVNLLRSCETSRDEQTELLVVFGGKHDPLIEKRPSRSHPWFK